MEWINNPIKTEVDNNIVPMTCAYIFDKSDTCAIKFGGEPCTSKSCGIYIA